MAAAKSKVKKQKTIIIVGGALAGPTAAARAREIDEHARIILLERNTRVSYAMSGLALHLSGEVASLDELNREREDFFAQVYNVEVRTRTEVTAIYPKKKCIEITAGSERETLAYDALIFATGAASLQPIGAKEAANFRHFRTLDDLAAIKASLAGGNKRFVVLGGGSMGAEAFDGLVRGGADVTLIEKKMRFLPDYSPEISQIVTTHSEHKAKIFAGFKQLTFEYDKDMIKAVLVDGMRIEADFVVSAIGVTPRTELLKKSGIRLASDGTVLVDHACRTNIKDIYACSICVSVPEGKHHRWIPQAAVSDKTAQVAGENAAGGKARLGFFSAAQIIRLPNIEVGRVGLTYEQALEKVGKPRVISTFIHARDTEPYMPASATLSLKLFYDKKTHALLGLEAAGRGVKARLDAFATALAGKLTIDDLALLDLAYTPAFGTARDALNIAATVAVQKANGITTDVTFDEIKAKRTKFFVLDVSTAPEHAGFHDAHIPLEKLRAELSSIRAKFKASKSKQIATLSETGRRGHLALRILKDAGLPVVNIAGGRKIG